jgi:prepilin-type N-terminal cleavage/methylation domain-containing protein
MRSASHRPEASIVISRFLGRDQGFTLLEIVVVMAIIAAGLVIILWGMNAILPELHLKEAVRNLKSDMHLARLTAIRKNTFIVLEFNIDENSYKIYMDDGGGDSVKANNYCKDPGETSLKFIRMHPHVDMYSATFGSVAGKFAFNSRGSIDGLAGGIYMHNKIDSYRGLTVSRIGKLTIKTSTDGSNWHRTN